MVLPWLGDNLKIAGRQWWVALNRGNSSEPQRHRTVRDVVQASRLFVVNNIDRSETCKKVAQGIGILDYSKLTTLTESIAHCTINACESRLG